MSSARRAPAARGREASARRRATAASRRSSHDAPSTGSRTTQNASSQAARARPRSGSCSSAQSSTARTLSISGATRSKSQCRGTPIDRRGAGAVGELEQPVGLAPPQGVLLTRSVESLPCELADRLEHPEALLAVRVGAAADEALVEQRRQRVEIRVADRFGGVEGAAAAEDGEPGEQLLLVVVEQVVAPGDRRAQRRVALVGVAPALEQVEPLRDPLEQLLGAEELDPCRGELDREREAVEAADQLVHGGRVSDVGADRPRPLEEQRDGVALVHRRQVELRTRRRSAAARGSSPRSEAPARQRAGRRAAGRRRAAAARGCRGRHGLASRRSASRSRRNLSPEAPRRSAISGTTSAGSRTGASGTKTVPPSASSARNRASSIAKPCLPRAARADDREQAWLAVEPQGGRLEQLALASEELRRRSGQVDGARRPQRREVGDAELEQPGRSVEVLESVTAEIDVAASSTSAAVAAETITWPPCASAATRAPRWTSIPT